jgi:hypothetical protein
LDAVPVVFDPVCDVPVEVEPPADDPTAEVEDPALVEGVPVVIADCGERGERNSQAPAATRRTTATPTMIIDFLDMRFLSRV